MRGESINNVDVLQRSNFPSFEFDLPGRCSSSHFSAKAGLFDIASFVDGTFVSLILATLRDIIVRNSFQIFFRVDNSDTSNLDCTQPNLITIEN